MRAAVLVVVLGLVVSATARAEPGVDSELRALADRAARHVSPAGLAPLVEERVAAGDTAGLTAVIRSRTGGAGMGAADDGWLAAAYGAAGERAEVTRLAASVEAAVKTAPPDDMLRDAAECGVAMAFEYLRDHAAADKWRTQARGAWCEERLPVVAARLGDPTRAGALLADISSVQARVTAMLAVADVYTGGSEAARVAPLLEEAAKLIDGASTSLVPGVTTWPKVAMAWAAVGNKAAAKAAAKKALALLEADAKPTEEGTMMLLINGDDVAAGLAAAGETAALAKLVARMEKARAKDTRFVARLKNARVIAKFGAKKRAAGLVAGLASELESNPDVGRMFAERFVLIDAYLALGDLPDAIVQASRTSVTQPIEIEALVKVARHCRKNTCKRTPAITDALAAVGARLDKFDALRNRRKP